MPRVKRGVHHSKRRRNILKRAKGFRWGRKNQIKKAKTALIKSGVNAYRDRRLKKRNARALWQVKINAGTRLDELSYSKFIGGLKLKGIALDRKVLAVLAEHHPEVFSAIVKQAK